MKEQDERSERPDRPSQGRSPRKLTGLVLALALLAGLILAYLHLLGPKEPARPGPSDSPPAAAPAEGAAPQEPGTPASVSDRAPPPSEPGTNAAPAPPDFSSGTLPALPRISLPPQTIPEALESIPLPPLPYSIFNGAYRSLQEAEATQRELLTHRIPSYIVPVAIEGSVSQSLYGVSSDGIWYRILIGHFATQKDAREFLGDFMDLRPSDQPEIMRFGYALECGRFLDDDSPEPLLDQLRQDGFLPYTQTYPASTAGSSLTRVMLGSFFSKQGADQQLRALSERGYACTTQER